MASATAAFFLSGPVPLPTDPYTSAPVRGREDIFFGAEFSASAGTNKLPDYAVQYCVDRLAASLEELHGSFPLYRAFGATAAQNEERKTRRLPMPVLSMDGAEGSDAAVVATM